MADFLAGYVDVHTRLQLALERWPELRVQESEPTVVDVNGRLFIQVRTTVWRTPDDPLPAVAGTWQPFPGHNSFTKDSEMENASTSALGRALGLMGIGIQRSIASRDEVQRAQERRPKPPAIPPAPRAATKPAPEAAPAPTDGPPAMSNPAQRIIIEKLSRDLDREVLSGTELEQLTHAQAAALIAELRGQQHGR